MNMIKCPQCEMENPETEEFCSECGTRLESEKAASAACSPLSAARPAPIDTLAPGSTFSEQYKVIDYLGKGVTGKVYKVFDYARDRELALRLFNPELMKEEKAWERFTLQLNAARKIVHKNVARMFDFREEKGTPYVTMEYVPGQHLKSFLRQTRRLNAEKMIALARQTCFGLSEVHGAGVFHLDLKPGNILIDKEGVLKITDVGLAAALFPRGTTDSGISIGTKEYLSPEQLQGKEVDQGTDIYSLGVVLYEMATGEVPFKGDIPALIGLDQESEMPRNPHLLNPLVSEGLSRVILKCLEKDKDKRYRTAEEVRLDLEKIEEEEVKAVESAVPPVLPEKKPSPVKLRALLRPAVQLDWRKFLIPGAAGAAVILIGLLLWRFVLQPQEAPATPPKEAVLPSLVVLPFEDLDPAKKDQYLGTGMAETLNEALAGVQGLRVLTGTSFFALGSRGSAAQEAGKNPEVEYLATADFRVSEDRLHLAAKLIDQKTGAALWFKEFDLTRDGLPAAEEEIAGEILHALRIPKVEAERPLIKMSTADTEALRLFWQGKEFWRKGGKENLDKAVEYFQKAAARDPAYALAHTGLAYAYAALGCDHFRTPDETFPKAKTAVLDALQADANLSEAHTLLADLKSGYDWERTAAEKEYKEAIRLKPGSAAAHQTYALFLSSLGRHEEALIEITQARALDPLSSGIRAEVGAILYFARQYNEALAELKRAAAADSEDALSHSYSGLVCIQLGQLEDAHASFLRAAELGADPMETNLRRAYVYALQGRRSEVGRLLTEALRASKESYVSSVIIAAVYAGVGERDQAIACLQKALAERDAGLNFLKVHPLFDSVRGDPRFYDILKRIGLE
ncbi:MAG: protein kinase [Acidobacteriota bacterium]